MSYRYLYDSSSRIQLSNRRERRGAVHGVPPAGSCHSARHRETQGESTYGDDGSNYWDILLVRLLVDFNFSNQEKTEKIFNENEPFMYIYQYCQVIKTFNVINYRIYNLLV